MGRPDPLPQERRRRISRSSREKVYNNLSVARLRVIINPRAIQREWKGAGLLYRGIEILKR